MPARAPYLQHAPKSFLRAAGQRARSAKKCRAPHVAQAP